jgi:hypothetical protein
MTHISRSSKADRKSKEPQLEPEAKQALGNISPELLKVQLCDMVIWFVEEHWDQAEMLGREMDLPMYYSDLQDLLEVSPPVPLVNQLHYAAPNLNLQDLNHQQPLEVLKAVITMFTTSERMVMPSPDWTPGLATPAQRPDWNWNE